MGKGYKHGCAIPLNFAVKTYPSEVELKADKPKANTIGVITTTTMTSWVFSATEPTEPEVGMVWISLSNESSVEFNALKKNTLQVYPNRAKQYVNSEWKSVTSMSYQDSKWKNLSEIPSEYQAVKYLESSGTQYINTGVNLSSEGTGIKMEFERIAHLNDADDLYGSQNTGTTAYFTTFLHGATWNVEYGAGGVVTLNATSELNKKQVISHNYKNDQQYIIDGATLAQNLTSAVSALEVYLFGCNFNGSFSRSSSIRIYACEMTVGTEVVRKFVPCYRKSDSVAGLYDTIGKKFYTNAGSGIFTVGGDA